MGRSEQIDFSSAVAEMFVFWRESNDRSICEFTSTMEKSQSQRLAARRVSTFAFGQGGSGGKPSTMRTGAKDRR